MTKSTKGRRRRVVPIIDPLRPTLERLSLGGASDDRLVRDHAAASSPQRPFATPRAGTPSSATWGCPGWSATG